MRKRERGEREARGSKESRNTSTALRTLGEEQGDSREAKGCEIRVDVGGWP